MKVFEISQAEMEEKFPEKTIPEKCGGCGWEQDIFYVIADNKEEAETLFVNGDATLCAECMCRLLSEEDYNVDKEDYNVDKEDSEFLRITWKVEDVERAVCEILGIAYDLDDDKVASKARKKLVELNIDCEEIANDISSDLEDRCIGAGNDAISDLVGQLDLTKHEIGD